MIEILIYSTLYLVLFGFTDLLYYKANIKVEITRKIVHISTGIIALTFPFYLTAFWQVIVLCSSFLVLLAVSEKFGWFKSITAVERKSYGSWLFALIVLVCFYVQLTFNNLGYYYLPILVLTVSDPLAAVVGKRFNFGPIQVFGNIKTLGGSGAFFVSTLLILSGYKAYFNHQWGWATLVVASLIITLLELVSVRGWDNLSIPAGAMGFVYIMSTYF